MTDQPERLNLNSHDIAGDKLQELLGLFPEIRTEGGKIDFERLNLALGETVDAGKERYGMNWPGKAECFKTLQQPSLATLRPCPEESVNFNTTENLIIEGDNLEVLKLLQKSYLGKVKMIYIDPPYNTGNDFIYPDNYTESLQTYLEYTGQVDAGGRKFGTNTDTDGRFHSKWLNMMYPRLYLARNLLREDGIIFISIDDNEMSNLTKVCGDIFGEDSLVGVFSWKNKYGAGAKTKGFIEVHEYILCYAKNQLKDIEAELTAEQKDEYDKRDEKYAVRGGYVTQPLMTRSLDDRENLQYEIEYKGDVIYPRKQWVWEKPRLLKAIQDNEVVFKKKQNGEYSVRAKVYLKDENGITRKGKPISSLNGPFNQEGTEEVAELLGEDVFSFPKPKDLLKYFLSFIINNVEDNNGLYLDFFAGSGTTAHAVLDLNQRDGGNRKYILVQLPEPTGREDYPTIADITKERVRRVIKKLDEADAGKLDLKGEKKEDRGFRVFKLAESNFKPWNAQGSHDAGALEKQLELHIAHIREDRSPGDILYEILLKSGFPLTTPVENIILAGKTVHSVADGALFICLEQGLTLELIRAMAAEKPQRVVCLDEDFVGNDQLKANAVQIFKAKGISTFKTV